MRDIWKVWTDVDHWHLWQDDIDYAKLEGEFKVGSKILFKPKGMSKVTLEIVEMKPHEIFTDLTRFPLAKMYGCHEFMQDKDAIEIKTTMTVEGPLTFLWVKLVAQGVADSLQDQTEKLIEQVKRLRVAI